MSDADHAPLTADAVSDQILSIVAKEANIDRALLQQEARIDALGIPSLDMTMAVFELEKHFDIEIPVIAEKPGAEFTTVDDLVSHVRGVLVKAGRIAGPFA
jgi:acyl carrier protein